MKDDTDADSLATRDPPARPELAAATKPDKCDESSGSGRLEVRCPNCHAPTEVAVDTTLTDLTCSACGSHFSLVDQSQDTRMAPSLSQLGRFELIERLGVGGFGSVWKARDKELDRTVAIKIPRAGAMSSTEQEQFFREARAAAQLKHPSIVCVHEVGRDGDSIYIVSDFVRGVTLGDWLTGQQLTSREAAELCAKIADALHHAHEQGVVHRDLKPANIMMDYDGQPHLMDFGLARRDSGEITVTLDGQVLGTPAYMSPEQAQGEAHTADRRSDVYSLGVILFQLLTGELPFRGNARMLIKQVIHDEPPSPRMLNANVPRDLDTMSLKCLQKDPARRYQSARDVSEELKRFLKGEPIKARPMGRAERVWRWVQRNSLVAGLCALTISLLLAGGIASTVLWRRAERERVSARYSETLAQSRLIAEQLARQQTNAEAAKATAISNLLQQMLESANPDTTKGAEYTVRDMLDDFSSAFGAQLQGQPEAEASIRATIGNAYRRLNLLDKAEPQLRTALDLRRHTLGPEHADVAQSLHDYAFYLFERANYVEAENSERKAIAIHRKLGLRNRATVELLSTLQLILNARGRFKDAEAVAQEALVIAREQSGQNPEVPNILHRLTDASIRQGDFAKGEQLARESVEQHRKLHGDNHPETAWGLFNLALSLEKQRKFVEAEQHYREALSIFLKQFDESHFSVATTSELLEHVLKSKGDQAGLAAFLAEKTERVTRAVRSHPADAELRSHLYKSQNDLASILATSELRELRDGNRAVELASQACKSTDYKNPVNIATLAAAYAETGDFVLAVKWSEKSLDLTKDDGDAQLRATLSQSLASYKAKKPIRVPAVESANQAGVEEKSSASKPSDLQPQEAAADHHDATGQK